MDEVTTANQVLSTPIMPPPLPCMLAVTRSRKPSKLSLVESELIVLSVGLAVLKP